MKQAVLSCQQNRTIMKDTSNVNVIIKLILWNILVVVVAILMAVF